MWSWVLTEIKIKYLRGKRFLNFNRGSIRKLTNWIFSSWKLRVWTRRFKIFQKLMPWHNTWRFTRAGLSRMAKWRYNTCRKSVISRISTARFCTSRQWYKNYAQPSLPSYYHKPSRPRRSKTHSFYFKKSPKTLTISRSTFWSDASKKLKMIRRWRSSLI